jgi:predicted RecB family endonuclease
MATNCESLTGVQGKVIEAVAAFTQANQRVVGELIELSSQAARESLRTLTELQAAAMETVQAMPMPAVGQSIEELRQDPFAFYRKGFQATAKLVETNTQIVTRNVERMQESTGRAAREIEQAASGYMSRMKDIYSR